MSTEWEDADSAMGFGSSVKEQYGKSSNKWDSMSKIDKLYKLPYHSELIDHALSALTTETALLLSEDQLEKQVSKLCESFRLIGDIAVEANNKANS